MNWAFISCKSVCFNQYISGIGVVTMMPIRCDECNADTVIRYWRDVDLASVSPMHLYIVAPGGDLIVATKAEAKLLKLQETYALFDV